MPEAVGVTPGRLSMARKKESPNAPGVSRASFRVRVVTEGGGGMSPRTSTSRAGWGAGSGVGLRDVRDAQDRHDRGGVRQAFARHSEPLYDPDSEPPEEPDPLVANHLEPPRTGGLQRVRRASIQSPLCTQPSHYWSAMV